MEAKQLLFPFTRIVGQEEMKRALLLNIIDPSIGGVLIKGEKGTAKSTMVRSLGQILPSVKSLKVVYSIATPTILRRCVLSVKH